MQPAEVLNNKGTQLMQGGSFKAAIAFFRRAVSQDPANLSFRINLAIGLSRLSGSEEEAAGILKEVIAADPSNTIAIHALGVLAELAGAFEDAHECFKDCAKIAGTNADAQGYSFDVATSTIRLGRWEEGWEAYECRRRWKPQQVFEHLPTWKGEQDKLIYCWAEQGLGDILQFSRYVPWLARQSKRTLFAVPAAMNELFQPFAEVCDLAPLEAGVPAQADFEIPLMSLPLMYSRTGDIPGDPGYIPSSKNKHHFAIDKKNVNIGVCWAASKLAVSLADRQVELEEIVQLAGDSTRKLYSLQGDNRVKQIYDLGVQQLIQDMTPRIEGDWCATRDLIRAMDYVVTVDTSVAHLAGIMRKPTFLLIGNRDSWRWSYDWYPTMTILRQSVRGSWDAELRKIDGLIDQKESLKQAA